MATAEDWPLRLEVANGVKVIVNLRSIDSLSACVNITILREGRVVDEPDAIVDIGGEARFDVDCEPVVPMMVSLQGPCPLSATVVPTCATQRKRGHLSVMRSS